MARQPLKKKALDYLEWLSLPEPLRDPQTKTAWCEKHGVSSQTLYYWEDHPDFKARWADAVKNMAQSPERTEALLDSLFKRGINGDTRSAELYLKATGQMPNPKTDINIKTEKVEEISDDELRALIAEYAQKEQHDRTKIEKDDK